MILKGGKYYVILLKDLSLISIIIVHFASPTRDIDYYKKILGIMHGYKCLI